MSKLAFENVDHESTRSIRLESEQLVIIVKHSILNLLFVHKYAFDSVNRVVELRIMGVSNKIISHPLV